MADVVVLGNFVVDIIAKPVDRLPERGRLLLIDTLETHSGGNGPNTAGALGKLGFGSADQGPSVMVAGRTGEDLYGRFLLERLEGWNVDTRPVVRDQDCATGVTLVAVDSSGERSFIHHFGANARFGPGDLDWHLLSGARHLHLASFFILPGWEGAAAPVLAEARRRGMSTSLDVCWDREGRWMLELASCLPHLDLMMPSEEEARELTGKTDPAAMAKVFLEAGCRAAVIKLGARGCYYAGEEGACLVPAYDVAVRETTGAGDCFIAGFLHARLRGWDLPRALRFANACGARSVSQVGAVTGMAAASEVEAWAQEQRIRTA
jgi:sugar/nucleoside kinase (ribokinase family)